MSLRGLKIMEHMFESSVRSLQCFSQYTPPAPRSLRQIKQKKRLPLTAVFGPIDIDNSPNIAKMIETELEDMEKGAIGGYIQVRFSLLFLSLALLILHICVESVPFCISYIDTLDLKVRKLGRELGPCLVRDRRSRAYKGV